MEPPYLRSDQELVSTEMELARAATAQELGPTNLSRPLPDLISKRCLC